MSVKAATTRLSSMTLNTGPLSPLKPPAPTPLVTELLTKNDLEHDIYFGKNHFHNHFPHTLLSQFAIGAPESRLKKEWVIEDYLSPISKKQDTEITDSNWKEFIGRDNYYHNYLDYFKDKLKKDGVKETVLKYVLDETLLPSVVSGAVHPLIHVGFGIEFGVDMVVAEGISEACVHSPAFAPVVDIPLYSKPSTDSKSLLEIVDEIYHDKTFDDSVKFSDSAKSTSVLNDRKATEAIKQYVMKWPIEDSSEGYVKAYRELFELVAHFVASSAFPPPEIINNPKFKNHKFHPLLDFFLMHTLTATYGLRQLLPLVPSDKIPLCLRVDLAVSLTYYVSRGRPLVQPDKLPQTPYSWDDIIKKTWTNEDLHVPKVIRALKTISEAGEMDATLARNAAGIVVQEKIDGGRRWSFLGHGFDEAWEQKEAGDENERD